MIHQRDIDRWLTATEGRFARSYTMAIARLMMARARMDKNAADAAFAELNRIMLHVGGIGEAFGAQLSLRHAAGAAVEALGGAAFGADLRNMVAFREAGDILSSVTLTEAVDDLAQRVPKILRGAAERTAANIARLYSEGRVIAFARSADVAVTQRVQQLFAAAIKDGTAESVVGRYAVIAAETVATETQAWTEAYARMAFRTNLNTAVTAGRFRAAQDRDVKVIMPAMRYDAVNDSDTRPNHAAYEGVIWSVDNPLWQGHAPPNGYACRCQIVPMSIIDVRRAGRLRADGSVIESPLPPGAHPDPGFRHGSRPDLAQVTT